MVLNLLHISDLHYQSSRGRFDQDQILKALSEDLKEICDGPLTPDLVIFSGDIARAGDEDGIYEEAFDNVIVPLLEITRCDESRFILVPGNHDARRSHIQKKKSILKGMRSTALNREQLNEICTDEKTIEYVKDTFKDYRVLSELLGSSDSESQGLLYDIHRYPELQIDVVTLNTAWLTAAGITGFGTDKGFLAIPEAVLQEAIDQCTDIHTKILATHHPLEWLEESNLNRIERQIGDFDIHVFGHMHIPRPNFIRALDGETLRNQSGALFQGRERYNGYSLVRFDQSTRHSEIRLRTFFSDRSEFDVATDVVSHGVFHNSDSSRQYFHQQDKKIDVGKLKEWIEGEVARHARKDFDDGLAKRPLGELFVEPPLRSIGHSEERKTDADRFIPEKSDKRVFLSEIISSNRNWVLHGDREYGKTSILKRIAMLKTELVRSKDHKPKVPVLIDFTKIRPGADPVLRAIRQTDIPEPEAFTFQQLATEGFLTILIDDVDYFDSQRLGLLSSFIESNSRNQFVFTTTSGRGAGFGISEELVARIPVPTSFSHASIEPMNHSKLRALVDRWGGRERRDVDEVLERLAHEFRSLNIPVTAVNGTILLTLLDNWASATPVNAAVLIERFLEHMLEKSSIVEAFRRNFDFTNKMHVLANLAHRMCILNEYEMPRHQVEEITREYLDSIGLNPSPSKLMDYFVSSRVMAERSGNLISFRYRAFVEYLLAWKMKDDRSYRDWVLGEERFLSFRNEIQYYAGLSRNDQELIDDLGNRFSSKLDQFEAQAGIQFDVSKLDKFELPHVQSENDLYQSFEDQLSYPPLSDEERDAVLDRDHPVPDNPDQAVVRREVQKEAHQLVQSLAIYTGVLKNLEVIPKEVKREHLAKILNGWAIFTGFGLAIVPVLAEKRSIEVSGIRFAVAAPMEMSETELARFLYAEFPCSVSRTMLELLATEKLEEQLLSPTLDEQSEPLLVEFLRTSLVVDLRLGAWTKVIAAFAKKIRKSKFFGEVAARKLSDVYLMGGQNDAELNELKPIIADVISNLRPQNTKSDREKTRQNVLQELDQKNLLRRLKQEHTD